MVIISPFTKTKPRIRGAARGLPVLPARFVSSHPPGTRRFSPLTYKSKNFSVWWKDDSKARIATSGHVFVDGRDVASAIMRPGRSKPVERLGAKTSSKTIKPFKFSVLRVTGTPTFYTLGL